MSKQEQIIFLLGMSSACIILLGALVTAGIFLSRWFFVLLIPGGLMSSLWFLETYRVLFMHLS